MPHITYSGRTIPHAASVDPRELRRALLVYETSGIGAAREATTIPGALIEKYVQDAGLDLGCEETLQPAGLFDGSARRGLILRYGSKYNSFVLDARAQSLLAIQRDTEPLILAVDEGERGAFYVGRGEDGTATARRGSGTCAFSSADLARQLGIYHSGDTVRFALSFHKIRDCGKALYRAARVA